MFCRPVILRLLNFVTEIIQMADISKLASPSIDDEGEKKTES